MHVKGLPICWLDHCIITIQCCTLVITHTQKLKIFPMVYYEHRDVYMYSVYMYTCMYMYMYIHCVYNTCNVEYGIQLYLDRDICRCVTLCSVFPFSDATLYVCNVQVQYVGSTSTATSHCLYQEEMTTRSRFHTTYPLTLYTIVYMSDCSYTCIHVQCTCTVQFVYNVYVCTCTMYVYMYNVQCTCTCMYTVPVYMCASCRYGTTSRSVASLLFLDIWTTSGPPTSIKYTCTCTCVYM